jgi:hypothetical protein
MQGGGYAEAVQPRHCDNGDVIQNQFFVLTGWESWAVASKRMVDDLYTLLCSSIGPALTDVYTAATR